MEAINKIWETKNGKKIHIKDMSTNHIENTIELIRRKCAANFFDEVPFPCFQGEYAQYFAEQEYFNISLDDFVEKKFPIVKVMQKELYRRGIDV